MQFTFSGIVMTSQGLESHPQAFLCIVTTQFKEPDSQ